MEIALTPEAERFVQAQVESGHFRDASEVVNAIVQNAVQNSAFSTAAQRGPKTIEELEELLIERCESMDRGEGIDGEKAYAMLKERLNRRSSR
jgi:antitoxin ParD1/3/4